MAASARRARPGRRRSPDAERRAAAFPILPLREAVSAHQEEERKNDDTE